MNNCHSSMIVELVKLFLGASNCTQVIVMVGVILLSSIVLKFFHDITPKIFESSIVILCAQFLSIMGEELRKGMKNTSGVARADFIVFILVLIGLLVAIAFSALGEMQDFFKALIVVFGIIVILLVSSLSVLLVYFERDKKGSVEKFQTIVARWNQNGARG